MGGETRTQNSVRNGIYALVFYVLNLILGFVSRRVFILRLGAELQGLNATLSSILEFLNIAELGIGTVLASLLYKPLFDKDEQKVSELIALMGWAYRRIAYFIIAGAVVVMAFMPRIFAETTLPLWYAYATFLVYLLASLLSYFVNYKQTLLSADQKEYKITVAYRFPLIIKMGLQILAIMYTDYGYEWWLFLTAAMAIVSSVMLSRAVKKDYPYVAKVSSRGAGVLIQKYPEAVKKVKQCFVHRIAGFFQYQSVPILTYKFASLVVVTMYTNYMMIVMGVNMLVNALMNGIQAGVGNLVAEGDREKKLSVFYELFSLRMFIAAVVSFGIYTLSSPFVTLWVGGYLVIDNLSLGLITAILFINISRSAVESYLYAHGMFQDIWAPAAEAAINIGLAVLLGSMMGLPGILIGSLVSLLVIVLGWKPYFLFKIGMKESLSRYWVNYIKHIVVIGVLFVGGVKLLELLPIDPSVSVIGFLAYGAIGMTVFVVALCGMLSLVSRGMRDAVVRMRHIILRR